MSSTTGGADFYDKVEIYQMNLFYSPKKTFRRDFDEPSKANLPQSLIQ